MTPKTVIRSRLGEMSDQWRVSMESMINEMWCLEEFSSNGSLKSLTLSVARVAIGRHGYQ